VAGEIYGARVKGSMRAQDVRVGGSVAPPPVPSPQPPIAQTQKDVKEKPEEPAGKPLPVEPPRKDDPSGTVTYMGKPRSYEFISFFHKRLKDEFCLKNTKTKEMCLKEKLTLVNSSDDIQPLIDGDVVNIEGQNAGPGSGTSFAIMVIFNEVYTRMDKPLALFRKSDVPRKGEYRILAVFAPGRASEVPAQINVENRVFNEIGPDEAFLSENDFIKEINEEKTYQIKCPKCEGKGTKKDLKNRSIKCVNCRGSGLLSPEASAAQLESDFKKEKK
jgi:hypothetical protein